MSERSYTEDSKEKDGSPPAQGVGREEEIYLKRFSPVEEDARQATWATLCRNFFQSYVPDCATVLDIGAGDGFFLKNIKAGRKIAVDLSAHARALESYGIEVFTAPATELETYIKHPVDVIFMSNFLEHLPAKNLVLDVLSSALRVLKPDGRLLILQPNIRYVGPAYWDYIDHHIALTEHSLAEALDVTGFEVERMIPRFLPYTAKSSLGRAAGGARTEVLVSWYLKMPFLWKIFGQQTFVCAKPKKTR